LRFGPNACGPAWSRGSRRMGFTRWRVPPGTCRRPMRSSPRSNRRSTSLSSGSAGRRGATSIGRDFTTWSIGSLLEISRRLGPSSSSWPNVIRLRSQGSSLTLGARSSRPTSQPKPTRRRRRRVSLGGSAKLTHNILWRSHPDPRFWSRETLQYRMFNDSHVELLLWGAS
jgi:hypothetical protein